MSNDINSLLWQARHESETNWLKAEQILKKAIKLYPKELKLYDELGDLYFSKELYNEAAKVYEASYVIDKNGLETVFKIAFCYLLEKNFEKSLYYFDKVSRVMPEAAYNKCIALYRLGRSYEAIVTLERLVDEFTYSEKPFILLAKLYLEYERYDKVIDLVERTEKLFGKITELTFVRATVHFNTGQWMKAYMDFKESEFMVSANPLYYRMYALTCERIGLTDKGISLLQRCIDEYPAYHGAYYDLIKILIMHNRHEESFKVVDKLYKAGITLSEIDNVESSFFNRVFKSF